MKRNGLVVLWGLVLSLALTGCGDSDEDGKKLGQSADPVTAQVISACQPLDLSSVKDSNPKIGRAELLAMARAGQRWRLVGTRVWKLMRSPDSTKGSAIGVEVGGSSGKEGDLPTPKITCAASTPEIVSSGSIEFPLAFNADLKRGLLAQVRHRHEADENGKSATVSIHDQGWENLADDQFSGEGDGGIYRLADGRVVLAADVTREVDGLLIRLIFAGTYELADIEGPSSDAFVPGQAEYRLLTSTLADSLEPAK